MKPRAIAFGSASDPLSAARCVVRVRFAEALVLAHALERDEPEPLHDLRIACKRLRYALERFAPWESGALAAAARLTELQDALGNIHDRDTLLAALPRTARITRTALVAERARELTRARELLHDAFARGGAFDVMIRENPLRGG